MGDSNEKEFSEKGCKKRVIFERFKDACNVRKSWFEFVKDSSFVALKRVMNNKLHWSERLFCLVIILVGAVLCSFGIFLSAKKFSGHMVQVVPDDEPSPIWSVPFPAVTICGTEVEGRQSESLKSFCEQACWDLQCACCEALFTETRTEIGRCYTFNNLAVTEIFKLNGITKEVTLSNASKYSENWDVQAGYKKFNFSVKYYPRRAMDLSADYELNIKFRHQSSITVTLHNPVDYPFRSDNAILVEPGQQLKIAVHPKVKTGRRYLKFSCPQATNCCYGDQCQLQFFQIYSQQNCELECRTKYMLDTRGCVQPYMPRPVGVPFCNSTTFISHDQLQKEITLAARISNIPPSKYFVKTCNCLPSCNEIRYKSVVTKNSLNETKNSQTIIHFEKDHFFGSKITIRYGIVDFFSTIGGLLSLFLGISFITIIEVLYYCTLRPFFI